MKAVLIARILLGLIFTIFGLNGFFNFIPAPPLEGDAGAFVGALVASKYMMPLVKVTEVLAGLMLLSGLYVPLALVLLAPVIVNIFFFHTVLAPPPFIPLFIAALEIFLAYSYRSYFAGVLTARAVPTTKN